MEIRLLILFLFTCTLHASERQAFELLQQFLHKPSTPTMYSERLPGMTNENYLITDEEMKYVVRLPGYETAKFIDRFSEWKNSNAAFEFHFNPARFLYCDPEKGAQITSYIPKFETLKFEEFYEKEVIVEIAALLKRVHESQMPFANRVDIFQRINALVQVLSSHSLQFPEEYSAARAGVDHLKKTLLNSSSFEYVPCHGDPVPSNFIILSDQLMLFDWEYSGLNDPAWDLAFLSCAMNYSDELDRFLISSYKGKKNDVLYAKMIFFKPVVEFWLGLWGLCQTLARENCAEKEFFRSYAISRFRKSQRYQESVVFNRSLEIVNENKCFLPLLYKSFVMSLGADSYLYDQNGKPLFVKLYIDPSQKAMNPLVDFPILIDAQGAFFTSMVQFGHWICPYCGILNPVEIPRCVCPHCPAAMTKR